MTDHYAEFEGFLARWLADNDIDYKDVKQFNYSAGQKVKITMLDRNVKWKRFAPRPEKVVEIALGRVIEQFGEPRPVVENNEIDASRHAPEDIDKALKQRTEDTPVHVTNRKK